MKFHTLKIAVFVIFFSLMFQFTHGEDLIIPVKKPNLSKETFKKKISKNIIIPLKKPILISEKKIKKVDKKKQLRNN